MGTGASTQVASAIRAVRDGDEELKASLKELSEADRRELLSALGGVPAATAEASTGAARTLPMPQPGWHDKVDVPERYLRTPTSIPETAERAMTLQQLAEVGELAEEILKKVEIIDPFSGSQVIWATINLYIINSQIVMPLTEIHKCSFVELVASGPQLPKWFISHWWGTPFQDTIRMLNLHAAKRALTLATACYWMCTFANNQHDLAELAVDDLLLTPFVKALMMTTCAGTIALMTESTAMPFKRIWCVLEDYISLVKVKEKESTHYFDVATIIPEKSQARRDGTFSPRCAALLTDIGSNEFDGGSTDDPSQKAWFPGDVAMIAVDVQLEEAQASNPSDKTNILRLVSTNTGGADEVNSSVRRLFFPQAVYNLSGSGRFVDSSKVELLLKRDFGNDKAEGCRLLNKSGALGAACTAPPHLNSKSGEFFKCIKAMLEFGADPNAPDCHNLPMSFACAYNWHDALQLLLEHRGDPLLMANTLKRGQASTPLLPADSGDDKADIFRKDGVASPIHFANHYGNGKTWQLLSDHGYAACLKCGWYGPASGPNEPDKNGRLPLAIACQYNIQVRVDALLRAKADPLKAEKEEDGKITASPLHYANKYGKSGTWSSLEEYGYAAHLKYGWYGPDAGPNEPDASGNLPLSIACQYNLHVRLNALLDAKADLLKAEKKQGEKITASPLHYANKHGNQKTWDILRERGFGDYLKEGWYGAEGS